MKKLILAVCLAFVSCSYPTYYQIESDKEFNFNGKKSIFVFLPPEPTLADKNNASLLKEAFKSFGYKIVETIDSANIAATIFITRDSKTFQNTIYLPSTSSTYGNIGSTYINATTTTTLPYSYSNTLKAERYYVYAYSVENLKRQITIPVWQAYAGVDISHIETDKVKEIRKLINLFGREYDSQKKDSFR